MKQVIDSISALIGNTPCIPLPEKFGRSNIYLKLEGFNPTGSLCDRLMVHSTIRGQELHIAGCGEMCASVALLGVVLNLPVTFEPQDESLFVAMAEAFGAQRNVVRPASMEFDLGATLKDLVEEIVAEVPGASDIFLSATLPCVCALDEINGIALHWVTPVHEPPDEYKALAKIGILIDPDSAQCVHEACLANGHVAIVVCATDGAMRLVR